MRICSTICAAAISFHSWKGRWIGVGQCNSGLLGGFVICIGGVLMCGCVGSALATVHVIGNCTQAGCTPFAIGISTITILIALAEIKHPIAIIHQNQPECPAPLPAPCCNYPDFEKENQK